MKSFEVPQELIDILDEILTKYDDLCDHLVARSTTMTASSWTRSMPSGRMPITPAMRLAALRHDVWRNPPNYSYPPLPPWYERLVYPWRYPDPHPFPRIVLFPRLARLGFR